MAQDFSDILDKPKAGGQNFADILDPAPKAEVATPQIQGPPAPTVSQTAAGRLPGVRWSRVMEQAAGSVYDPTLEQEPEPPAQLPPTGQFIPIEPYKPPIDIDAHPDLGAAVTKYGPKVGMSPGVTAGVAGVADTVGGVLSPKNAALMAGTLLAGPFAPLAGAGFSASMLSDLINKYPHLEKAYELAAESGNWDSAIRLTTAMASQAGLAATATATTPRVGAPGGIEAQGPFKPFGAMAEGLPSVEPTALSILGPSGERITAPEASQIMQMEMAEVPGPPSMQRQALDAQLAELDARMAAKGYVKADDPVPGEPRYPGRDPNAPALHGADPQYVGRLETVLGTDIAAHRAKIGDPVPLAGRSDETSTMPNGDNVTKLNPPTEPFLEALDRAVGNVIRPEELTAAARNIAVILDYNGKPITVSPRAGLPMSQTEVTEGGLQITVPEGAHAYEILHEVAEAAKMAGDPTTIPVHDNNVIADAFLKKAVAESATEPVKLGAAPTPEETAAISHVLSEASMGGAAALGHYGTAFAKQDVAPALGFVGKQAMKVVQHLWPEFGAAPDTVDAFTKYIGDIDRAVDHFTLNAFHRGWKTEADSMSQADQIRVVDTIKSGADLSGFSPKVQTFAEFIHPLQDAMYKQILENRPGTPYLENRLRLFWRKAPLSPPGEPAAAGAAPSGARSILGSLDWANPMKWQSLAEGMAKGGIPATTNWYEMTLMDLRDQSKYNAGMKLWNQLERTGDRFFLPEGEALPSGLRDFMPFDFNRTMWATQKELDQGAGTHYLSPDAYRLLNNLNARDPIFSGSDAHRAWWGAMMMDKAVTMALPLFHLGLEHVVGMASELGSILQNPGKTITDAGYDPFLAITRAANQMVTAPVRIARVGQMMREYSKSPEEFAKSFGIDEGWLKANPDVAPQMADMMGLFYRSAGRFGVHVSDRAQTFQAMREAFDSGNPVGGALRGIWGGIQGTVDMTVGPVFRNYIPNFKAGLWMRETLQELQRQAGNVAAGEITPEEIGRRVWNSIDDRAGSINYNATWYTQLFRNALQLAFLAPGFGMGTGRMLAKAAAIAPATEVSRMYDSLNNPTLQGGGFAPSLPYETRVLLNLALANSLVNATAQTLMSGQAPWETDTPALDLVFPRRGGNDENGKPNRLTLWGYLPKMYGMINAPIETAKYSLNPIVRRFIEAAQNQMVYNQEPVVDTSDGHYHAVERFLHFAAGAYPGIGQGPIASQAAQRLIQQGQDPQTAYLMGGAGIRPAPKYLEETPGEAKIRELAMHNLPSFREIGSAEHRDQVRAAEQEFRQGGDFQSIVQAGDFSKRELKTIASSGEKTQYDTWFHALGLKNKLVVWDSLSDEEKMKYFPMLNQTVVGKDPLMPRSAAWAGLKKSEIPVVVQRFRNAAQEYQRLMYGNGATLGEGVQ